MSGKRTRSAPRSRARNPLLRIEALMRIPNRLLLLPLLIVFTARPVLNAQVAPASTTPPAVENSQLTFGGNRLVPRSINERTASRRPARKPAAAAADSAGFGRIP